MIDIYHITHIENLPLIARTGGLVSDSRKSDLDSPPVSIAYDNIKEKRTRMVVPCGPGGHVADYVPFYFAPRSPMLYTISRGSIPGRNESDIVYLVSNAECVCERNLGYVYTDGHPIMAFTTFYDDWTDMDKVDWALMKSTYWHDIDSDTDRKRRRQAEFLVHDYFPFDLVGSIAVRKKEVGERVELCIKGMANQPEIAVRREWYYG